MDNSKTCCCRQELSGSEVLSPCVVGCQHFPKRCLEGIAVFSDEKVEDCNSEELSYYNSSLFVLFFSFTKQLWGQMSIPTQNMPNCKTNVFPALSLSEGEERFPRVPKQRNSLTELPLFTKNPLLCKVAVTDFQTIVNMNIFHINSRRMNPVCIYLLE